MNRTSRAGLGLVLPWLIPAIASGQIVPVPEGTPLPDYATRVDLPQAHGPGGPVNHLQLSLNGLPHILLTGYWPPTNEIVRRFSQSPIQNPGGWVGQNWENRGYNIYSFFPEFPSGLGQGVGDFEVDYQDTSADWWPLLNTMKPLGIITFSRGFQNFNWTVEGGNRTYPTFVWEADFTAPLRPEAGIPLIDLEPPFMERFSTLPGNQIIHSIQHEPALATVNPIVSSIDETTYLSNFIGYHGCWWHATHAVPSVPGYNAAAGHIHVGAFINLTQAQLAAILSIRALTNHLDTIVLNPRGDMNCDGLVNGRDIASFVLATTSPATYSSFHETCFLRRADMNADGAIDATDVSQFVNLLIGG